MPESFKVLIKELQSLGLSVEVLNDDEQRIALTQDTTADTMLELPADFGDDFMKGEY